MDVRNCENYSLDEEEKMLDHNEAFKYWRECGKEDINKILWTLLPGYTTLDEADTIAIKIHNIIDECWERKGG